MSTFNDILSELLDAMTANAESDINDILARKAGEMGLETTELDAVRQANALLDRVNEKVYDLEMARRNGATLQSFVAGEFDNLMAGKDEETQNDIRASLSEVLEELSSNDSK